MSLPKKDVRAYLRPEVHAGLRILASMVGAKLEHYVEDLVTRHVADRARDAILLADEFRGAGIDSEFRPSQFSAGDGR